MAADEAKLPSGATLRLGSARWRAHREIDGGLTFIDDDRRVVTGTYVTDILDVADGRRIATLDESSCRPAASNDGTCFAAAHIRVKIWSVDGELLEECDELPDYPRAVAFLPGDQQIVAVTRGGGLALLDVETGRVIEWDRIGSDRLDDLAISPDGLDAFALTETGRLLIRRVDPLGASRGPWTEEEDVRAFALFPGGSMVALAPREGSQIRIVRRSDGQTQHTLDQWGVSVLRFTPDGQLLIGRGPGDDLFLWRWRDGTVVARIEAPDVHTKDFDVSRDGGTLCAAAGASVMFWRLPDGAPLRDNGGPHGDMEGVRFTADGQRLVTVNRHDCRIWNTASGIELHRLDPCPRPALHVSPRGSVAAWVEDDGVVLEQLRSHQRERIELDPNTVVTKLALSHDEKTLAVGTAIALELRDLPGGQRRNHHGLRDERIDMIRFSADDTRVGASTRQGRVRVWDVVSGRRCFESRHGDEARCFDLSPDGRWLACDTGKSDFHLWDLQTGELDDKLDGDCSAGYRDLRFSPDNMLLAQLDWGREITLWDLDSRTTIEQLDPTPDRSTAIAFSPNGRLLATGNESGVALVWNVVATDRRLAGRAFIRQICAALRHQDQTEQRARSVYRAAPEREEQAGVWIDGRGQAVSIQAEDRLVTTTIHSRADHHRILLTVLTVAAPGEPSSASWLGRAGRWLRGRLTAAGRAERQAAERRAQDWRSLVRLRAASLDADHWVAQVADGTLTATFDHATLPAPEAVAELMAVIAKDE